MSILVWLIAGVLVGVITAFLMESNYSAYIVISTIGAFIVGSAYALISRSGDAIADILMQFRWESLLASIAGAIVFAICTELYLASRSSRHQIAH